MKELSKEIGLSVTQIYKWNWDQKKKEIASAPTAHTTPNSIDSHAAFRVPKKVESKQYRRAEEQVIEQEYEEDSYHLTFSSHRSDSQSLLEYEMGQDQTFSNK